MPEACQVVYFGSLYWLHFYMSLINPYSCVIYVCIYCVPSEVSTMACRTFARCCHFQFQRRPDSPVTLALYKSLTYLLHWSSGVVLSDWVHGGAVDQVRDWVPAELGSLKIQRTRRFNNRVDVSSDDALVWQKCWRFVHWSTQGGNVVAFWHFQL